MQVIEVMCLESRICGQVPVSMTTYYMHMDPTVFPSPTSLEPDRWLDAQPDGLMHHYLLPFEKGSRACAGQTLEESRLWPCLRIF